MDMFTLSENPSKKDPKYFQILMEKYNILPEDILYFDHKQEHVDAALKAGIQLSKFYADYDSVKDFIEHNKYKLVKLEQHNVDTGM
jgi:FMN phosphatase YigB (HAD superfamily)